MTKTGDFLSATTRNMARFPFVFRGCLATMPRFMAQLVFVAGPNAGRRFVLQEGECIIGRRNDCELFVPDMRVSRQHARLRRDERGWRIEDLGSNNGTFVNGHRIEAALLHAGDEIEIAANRIRVDLPANETNARPISDGGVTIVDTIRAGLVPSTEGANELYGTGFATNPSRRSRRPSEREVRKWERRSFALTSLLDIVATTVDPSSLLEKLAGIVLELFPHATQVGILIENERTGELCVSAQRRRDSARANTAPTELEVPGMLITQVVGQARGMLMTEATDAHLGSRMGAPLAYQQSQFGLIYVAADAYQFTQEDVDLLTSVGAQAGLALFTSRNAAQSAARERLERDLRTARQIQRSLLPSAPPDVAGLDFAVHYEPAFEIGGDFYDFIWHDQSHLALAVGDVAGKAVSAALYMARLTSELRSRAPLARTPARLIRRVNTEMCKLGENGMFSTLVYCVYDLESRALVFTNAGHCTPLLRRGDRVFPLYAERAHVAPVGVVEGLEVGEARVVLQPGDLVVLVSDGVVEAKDTKGNEYGISRLSRRLRTARGAGYDVVKAILADVDTFSAGSAQADDVTIVAMGIDERRAKRRTETLPGVDPESLDARSTPPPKNK